MAVRPAVLSANTTACAATQDGREREAAQRQGSIYAWYVVGVLMFAYVVSFVDRLILSLLVQPIRRDLGVSDLQIGLLAGIGFAFFYTIMGVPLARLADRVNRRWLIVAGVALWTAMTAASAFATTYAWLLVARIGVGVGEATLTPAATSMISDYFSRDQLAKAIGVYSTGVYLGSGVALLVGSAIVQATSAGEGISLPWLGSFSVWQLAFLLASMPGALVIALMFTVREPRRTEFAPLPPDIGSAEPKQTSEAASVREVLAFLREHRRLLTGHFIGYGALGTAVTAYLVWTPEMLHRTYGIAISQAGAIYGVLLITLGALAPYLGGRWAQRRIRRGQADAEVRVSIIGAVLLAPCAVAAPLMPNVESATLMLAPVVLLLALPQGLAPTILQLIAPNRMRAQVLSAFILLAVIAAYTVGPAAVPLCAELVFGSEQALDQALALVCGVLVPIGALALAFARPEFNARMIATGRR